MGLELSWYFYSKIKPGKLNVRREGEQNTVRVRWDPQIICQINNRSQIQTPAFFFHPKEKRLKKKFKQVYPQCGPCFPYHLPKSKQIVTLLREIKVFLQMKLSFRIIIISKNSPHIPSKTPFGFCPEIKQLL